MDQQEQDMLELYIETLQKTYNGADTMEIKGAENYIEGCRKTDKYFLKHMLQITIGAVNLSNTVNGIQSIDKNIKLQACMYIVRYVRAYLNDDNKDISFLKEYAQLLFQALISTDVSPKCRSQIQQSINFILQFDDQGDIRHFYLSNIMEVMGIQGKTILDQSNMLIALQCIYQETIEANILNSIFDQTIKQFDSCLGIFTTTLQQQLQLYQSGVQQQEQNVSNNQTMEQYQNNITECMQGLDQWSNCFKQMSMKFLQKTSPDYKQLVFKLMQVQGIPEKFVQILGFQINTQTQLNQCVISSSGFTFFDKTMNSIKAKTLKNYKRIVDFTLSKLQKLDSSNCAYFTRLDQILPVFIQTPIIFVNAQPREQLEAILGGKEVKSLFPMIFDFIQVAIQYPQFYEFYYGHYQQLILDVVFPLIRSTQDELLMMIDEPLEFKNLSFDLAEKQNSKIAKTQAAKFLESLCDNIDGASTFCVQFACAIIEKNVLQISLENTQVQSEAQKSYQSKFPEMQNFLNNCQFINASNRDEQTQTAFMILTILAYTFEKRKDYSLYVQSILYDFSGYLFSQSIPCIIRCRLSQFLSSIHEFIFQEKGQEEQYNTIIQYLMNTLENSEQKKEKVLTYVVIEGIRDIYDNPSLTKKNSKSLLKNIQILQKALVFTNNPDLIDLVQSIIINFAPTLKNEQERMASIVESTKTRAVLLMNLILNLVEKKKKKKKTQLLTKCLGLILQIIRTEEYVLVLPQIQQPLLEIFEFMQYPKFDFTFDILTILKDLIRQQKGITPQLMRLVKFFDPWLEQRNYVMHDMVILLNLYIHYGHTFISNSPDSIKGLINICFKVINSIYPNSSDADKAQGAIIIHNIVENLGQYFTQEMFQVIISQTFQIIQKLNPDLQDDQQDTLDFYFGRLIGNILSCFMVNFQESIQVIQNLNLVDQLIKLLIEKKEYFRHVYDTKVYILGMSNIILQPNLPEQIQIHYPKIFYTLTVLLQNQKIITEFESKPPREINDHNSDIDNEEEDKDYGIEYIFPKPFDPEQEDVDPDIIQDDDILQRIKSKILELDEFQFFRERLQILKQKDEPLFQRLINTLDQKYQQFLYSLLNLHRIQDQKTGTTSMRKIVKVKRNNQIQQQQQQQTQQQQDLQQQQFQSQNNTNQNF